MNDPVPYPGSTLPRSPLPRPALPADLAEQDLPVPAAGGMTGPERERFAAITAELDEKAHGANTKRAWLSDTEIFTAWCQERGHCPLPAHPETVMRFVQGMAAGDPVTVMTRVNRHTPVASKVLSGERKASTIARYVASIAAAHRAHGYLSPASHPFVTKALKGVRRSQAEKKSYTDPRGNVGSTATRQANPLNFPLLMRLITDGDIPEIDLAGFPEPRPDMSDARRKMVQQRRSQAIRDNRRIRLVNMRDRALLALAYDSKARRSEWVAITPADISQTELGWTLTLSKTKTNQDGGEPEIKVIRPEFVKIVHEWLREADLFHDKAAATSAILRRIGRHGHVGRALSDRNLVEIIRSRALRAGVERHIAEGLTGHSTRVGVIQDMVASGLGTAEVQIESGHKTAVMLNRYARKLLAARGAGQKLVEAQAAQVRQALDRETE